MNTKRFRALLFVATSGITTVYGSVGFSQGFTPDPIAQLQIRRLGLATNEAGAYSCIQDIKSKAQGNEQEWARQAIWFSAKTKGESEVWTGLFLMGQLGITNSDEILETITPFLWTRDEDLKDQLREFVYNAAAPQPTRDGRSMELDFNHFVSILTKNKTNPPVVLVDYMFSFSVSQALKVLCGIYIEDLKQRQQILDADHALSDYLQSKQDAPADERAKVKQAAQEALDLLSQRNEWPVRRYVEAMKGNPKLRF